MKFRVLLALLVLIMPAYGWGNGLSFFDDPIYTDDINFWQRTTMYGTHDYLAEYALEFLPEEEKEWISQKYYYYGTELPDGSTLFDEHLSNYVAQHLEFDQLGNVVDDSLADMAMRPYDSAVNSLSDGKTGTASTRVGTINAYIQNAGLFSRVITAKNGANFEGFILPKTDIVYPSDEFEDLFGYYIEFDGALETISPYDAIMRIGRGTYMGKKDGTCSAQWMDDNYDTENAEWIACAGRNFNNIINAEADVLHTIYMAANGLEYEEYAYDWENFKPEPEPVLEPEPEPELESEAETAPELLLEPEPEEADETINESDDYIPAPVPTRRSEGGIWTLVIVLLVVLAIAALTFRNMGKKKRRKGIKRAKKK